MEKNIINETCKVWIDEHDGEIIVYIDSSIGFIRIDVENQRFRARPDQGAFFKKGYANRVIMQAIDQAKGSSHFFKTIEAEAT